jgi:hypothetical protein
MLQSVNWMFVARGFMIRFAVQKLILTFTILFFSASAFAQNDPVQDYLSKLMITVQFGKQLEQIPASTLLLKTSDLFKSKNIIVANAYAAFVEKYPTLSDIIAVNKEQMTKNCFSMHVNWFYVETIVAENIVNFNTTIVDPIFPEIKRTVDLFNSDSLPSQNQIERLIVIPDVSVEALELLKLYAIKNKINVAQSIDEKIAFLKAVKTTTPGISIATESNFNQQLRERLQLGPRDNLTSLNVQFDESDPNPAAPEKKPAYAPKTYDPPVESRFSDQFPEWLKPESRLGSWLLKHFRSLDEATIEGNRRVVQRWIKDPKTTLAQFTNALFAAIDNGQKEIEHDLLNSRFVDAHTPHLVLIRHELVQLEALWKQDQADEIKMHQDKVQRLFHLSAYFGKTQNLQDFAYELPQENYNVIHFDRRINSHDVLSAAMTLVMHGDAKNLALFVMPGAISVDGLQRLIHDAAIIDGDAPVMEALLKSELIREHIVREQVLNNALEEILTVELAQHIFRHQNRQEIRNTTTIDEPYMKLDALLVLIKDNAIKKELREKAIQMAIENVHPSDHSQLKLFTNLSKSKVVENRAFLEAEALIKNSSAELALPSYNDTYPVNAILGKMHGLQEKINRIKEDVVSSSPVSEEDKSRFKINQNLLELYKHRMLYLKTRLVVQMAWMNQTEEIILTFNNSHEIPERTYDELVVISFSMKNKQLQKYLSEDGRWVTSLQDAKKITSKTSNSTAYDGIIAYEKSLQPSIASSWLRNQFVTRWPSFARWVAGESNQNNDSQNQPNDLDYDANKGKLRVRTVTPLSAAPNGTAPIVVSEVRTAFEIDPVIAVFNEIKNQIENNSHVAESLKLIRDQLSLIQLPAYELSWLSSIAIDKNRLDVLTILADQKNFDIHVEPYKTQGPLIEEVLEAQKFKAFKFLVMHAKTDAATKEKYKPLLGNRNRFLAFAKTKDPTLLNKTPVVEIPITLTASVVPVSTDPVTQLENLPQFGVEETQKQIVEAALAYQENSAEKMEKALSHVLVTQGVLNDALEDINDKLANQRARRTYLPLDAIVTLLRNPNVDPEIALKTIKLISTKIDPENAQVLEDVKSTLLALRQSKQSEIQLLSNPLAPVKTRRELFNKAIDQQNVVILEQFQSDVLLQTILSEGLSRELKRSITVDSEKALWFVEYIEAATLQKAIDNVEMSDKAYSYLTEAVENKELQLKQYMSAAQDLMSQISRRIKKTEFNKEKIDQYIAAIKAKGVNSPEWKGWLEIEAAAGVNLQTPDYSDPHVKAVIRFIYDVHMHEKKGSTPKLQSVVAMREFAKQELGNRVRDKARLDAAILQGAKLELYGVDDFEKQNATKEIVDEFQRLYFRTANPERFAELLRMYKFESSIIREAFDALTLSNNSASPDKQQKLRDFMKLSGISQEQMHKVVVNRASNQPEHFPMAMWDIVMPHLKEVDQKVARLHSVLSRSYSKHEFNILSESTNADLFKNLDLFKDPSISKKIKINSFRLMIWDSLIHPDNGERIGILKNILEISKADLLASIPKLVKQDLKYFFKGQNPAVLGFLVDQMEPEIARKTLLTTKPSDLLKDKTQSEELRTDLIKRVDARIKSGSADPKRNSILPISDQDVKDFASKVLNWFKSPKATNQTVSEVSSRQVVVSPESLDLRNAKVDAKTFANVPATIKQITISEESLALVPLDIFDKQKITIAVSLQGTVPEGQNILTLSNRHDLLRALDAQKTGQVTVTDYQQSLMSENVDRKYAQHITTFKKMYALWQLADWYEYWVDRDGNGLIQDREKPFFKVSANSNEPIPSFEELREACKLAQISTDSFLNDTQEIRKIYAKWVLDLTSVKINRINLNNAEQITSIDTYNKVADKNFYTIEEVEWASKMLGQTIADVIREGNPLSQSNARWRLAAIYQSILKWNATNPGKQVNSFLTLNKYTNNDNGLTDAENVRIRLKLSGWLQPKDLLTAESETVDHVYSRIDLEKLADGSITYTFVRSQEAPRKYTSKDRGESYFDGGRSGGDWTDYISLFNTKGLFSGVGFVNTRNDRPALIDGNKVVQRLQAIAQKGAEELKAMTQNERMLIFKGLVTAQLTYDQTRDAVVYLAKAAQVEHRAKAFPAEFGKFFSVLLVLELHKAATRDDVTMTQFMDFLSHGGLEAIKLANFSATTAAVTTGWGMAEQLVYTKLERSYRPVIIAEAQKVPVWGKALSREISLKGMGKMQIAMLAATLVNQMIYGPKMTTEELLANTMLQQTEFFMLKLLFNKWP